MADALFQGRITALQQDGVAVVDAIAQLLHRGERSGGRVIQDVDSSAMSYERELQRGEPRNKALTILQLVGIEFILVHLGRPHIHNGIEAEERGVDAEGEAPRMGGVVVGVVVGIRGVYLDHRIVGIERRLSRATMLKIILIRSEQLHTHTLGFVDILLQRKLGIVRLARADVVGLEHSFILREGVDAPTRAIRARDGRIERHIGAHHPGVIPLVIEVVLDRVGGRAAILEELGALIEPLAAVGNLLHGTARRGAVREFVSR